MPADPARVVLLWVQGQGVFFFACCFAMASLVPTNVTSLLCKCVGAAGYVYSSGWWLFMFSGTLDCVEKGMWYFRGDAGERGNVLIGKSNAGVRRGW